ncbi:MAG: glycosyltransferase family 9 protein [Candidatus Oleimicrobiaceae bacterium]
MDDYRHILVSRLRFLGDVVLTTPVLGALRHAFPQATIAYLAENPYLEVLAHHPHVDELISVERNTRLSNLCAIMRLRRGRFDVAIDLFGNPRSALLLWLSGARRRLGFDYRGRRLLYTMVVRRDARPKSAIEFHLQALQPLGVPTAGLDTRLATSPDEDAWAEAFLREKGLVLSRPLAVVHPGASWPAKRWLPERFSELARRMAAELGMQVLLTQGPGEEKLVTGIAQQAPGAVVCGTLPIRSVMAIIKRCQVLVANDCGILHLGPALGRPTVGIFGPGEPEIWFPYAPEAGHRVVHKELACSRCHRDFCEKLICMEAIQVEEVLEAAAEAGHHGQMTRPVVFTIGHSSLAVEEFVGRLRAHGIRRIVDVRRFPTSRSFPHFDQEPLRGALSEAGIEYRWLGPNLGGFRSGGYEAYMRTQAFAAGIAELRDLATGLPTAIMCSEGLFFRCHRRFIAEELVRQGWRVVHILDARRTQEHRPKRTGHEASGGPTHEHAQNHH